MKPWIRKTILALALVIAGMVGVALWKPAYLFGAAAAIAPDLTAKMVVKWSLYRKELITKSFSPEEQKKNLEEQTIRIELGGRKYDIPVRYAYGEGFEKHGYWPKVKSGRTPVGALTLNVLLLDMKPYYPEDDARWKVRGHGEKVDVTITSSYGPADWYPIFKNRYFSGQDLYTKRTDDVYELAYFASTGGLDDSFFPLDEKQELSIGCTRKTDTETPYPSCKVTSNYKPGIALSYFYSREFLKNWRQIDANLKAMFDRFEQSASSAEHVHTAK